MESREILPIAGGTDVIPRMRDGKPAELLDTLGLGLDHVKNDGSSVEIGPSVTHESLSHDPIVKTSLPLLSSAAAAIGSLQIRNRGTIGGNIVNASPSADSLPALLNYDAEVVLASKSGKRRMKLQEFVTGPYCTARKADELLTSILCKTEADLPGTRRSTHFVKLGRRNAVNISRMSLALSVTAGSDGRIRSARVSAGAVFPVARRMLEVERLLDGESMTRELFERAGVLATELLIAETGVRWSSPYKMPVLKSFLERALGVAAKDCGVNAA